MADSKLALEPLMNPSDSTTQLTAYSQQPEMSSMKLCYLLEDNKPISGLVTTTDDIITPHAKSWIIIQYISTGQTKEYEKDKVKVSIGSVIRIVLWDHG